MKQQNNNIQEVPKMLLVTIIFLLAITLLSVWRVDSGIFKKVNILSDVFTKTDVVDEIYIDVNPVLMSDSTLMYTLANEYVTTGKISYLEGNPYASKDSTKSVLAYVGLFLSKNTPTEVRNSNTADSKIGIAEGLNIVKIEDFSDNHEGLKYFYDALENVNELNRPVRIAFVGDSFIEGDILTSDLRETLQSIYGGRGVGFVPLAPVAKYRNTLKQDFSGWTTYSVLYPSKIDKSKMIINGQYFVPKNGAYTSLESTNVKSHSSKYNKATLLFSSMGKTSLTLDVNKVGDKIYETEAKAGLQKIEVKSDDILSVKLKIQYPNEFVGYGFFLNDERGVYVDNYSLRSSTGLTLAHTDLNLLTQFNEFVKYDLVILQYGLNIAEPTKTAYPAYRDKMIGVVNYLKKAMPQTSFLIFSVGDRNFKSPEGEIKTMPGIINMVDTQREIAKGAKVAFWNTYKAMGGMNSMKKFVQNYPPLANKDYTHINYAGGSKIADLFAASLIEASHRY